MRERYTRGQSSTINDAEGGPWLDFGKILQRLNEQHEEIQRLTTWIDIEDFDEARESARYSVLLRSGIVSTAKHYRDGSWYMHMHGADARQIVAFMPAPDPSTFKPVEKKSDVDELREVLGVVLQYSDLQDLGRHSELHAAMLKARELINR